MAPQGHQPLLLAIVGQHSEKSGNCQPEALSPSLLATQTYSLDRKPGFSSYVPMATSAPVIPSARPMGILPDHAAARPTKQVP